MEVLVYRVLQAERVDELHKMMKEGLFADVVSAHPVGVARCAFKTVSSCTVLSNPLLGSENIPATY